MEKLALIEVATTSLRLTLAEVSQNNYFVVYKELAENINLDKHLEDNGTISQTRIAGCIKILEYFKQICNAEGIMRTVCVASNSITKAKNCHSFLDEAGVVIGTKFRILTEEDENREIYNAVINTLDIPKGFIINISSHFTRVVAYSRRVLVDSVALPYGYNDLIEKFFDEKASNDDYAKKCVDFMKTQLADNVSFLRSADPESVVIGTSELFSAFGKLARKITKYPVEIEHNYQTNKAVFDQVFDFIKDNKAIDLKTDMTIKGVSSKTARQIFTGLCIAKAFIETVGFTQITTSTAYRSTGLLYEEVLPELVEKPLMDILKHSLQATINGYGLNADEAELRKSYAITLFKQLKIIHKLPRPFAKSLQIAASLYGFGKKINKQFFIRNNGAAILNSGVIGASHKELVIAALAASMENPTNFNLNEFIKYKNIMEAGDDEAIKKLAMLLHLAETLVMRPQGVVKDIACDILGNSVIVKLITNLDPKDPKIEVNKAEIEVFYMEKLAADFPRIFKKEIEII
ncbi:MAG: hypothetical protein LBM01_01720 [Christensenellaceae bacterium]|jgi:exopolyphosphatase/guanosine-5'-triphosphate,3'-diphosphate pyrophosphatase|nr:hypothetical protein [Christensenellaceae bacterium]